MKFNSAPLPAFIANVPKKLLESLPYWVAAALVALASGLYMKFFALAEEWSFHNVQSTLAIFILPSVGLILSMSLAYFFSKESTGTGIPQIIAACEIAPTHSSYLEKLVGYRVLIIKPLASTLCVLFGGVTGREGPTLHISGSIFYLVNKYWPKKISIPSLSSMLIAGGAAGLAAAFNTPLGGITFAIEELSKLHISHTRTSIFHAVIISGILSQAFLGNYLYFGSITTKMLPLSALWQTLFLAAVIGYVATLFSMAILKLAKWNSTLVFKKKFFVALGFGILLSCVIYFCGPNTLGAGKSVIVDIVNDKITPSWSLGFARIFGNLFTFGAGVVGGVFAPSLASGAALAQAICDTFSFVNPHLMIMIGMVAFLTGVTRAPLTSFVLVMEMSNSHDAIIYLILSSLIANSISKLILPESFYEQMAHVFVNKSKIAPNSSL